MNKFHQGAFRKDANIEEVDFETMVKTLWSSVETAHERMSCGFPTAWDAYWYGTFTTVFSQLCFEKGDAAIERIVGKKKYRRYVEEHENLMNAMFDSCCPEDIEDIFEEIEAVVKGK